MNKKLMILSFCLITILSLTIVSANDTNNTQVRDEVADSVNEITQEITDTYYVNNSNELGNAISTLSNVKDKRSSTINLKKGTYKTDINWDNENVKLLINANNSELLSSNISINKNSNIILDSIIFNQTSVINSGDMIIANSIFTTDESEEVTIENNGNLVLDNCSLSGFSFNQLRIHNNEYMYLNDCSFNNIFRISSLIENEDRLVINNSYFTTRCDLTSTQDPIISNTGKLLINNSLFNDELNSFICDPQYYEDDDYTYSETVIVNSTFNHSLSQYAYDSYIENVKLTILNSTFNQITHNVDALSDNSEEEDYKNSHVTISGENINLIGNIFRYSRINFSSPAYTEVFNIISTDNVLIQENMTAPSGKIFNRTDLFDKHNNKTIENSDNVNMNDINNYVNTFLTSQSESIKTDYAVLDYIIKVNDKIVEASDVQYSEAIGNQTNGVTIVSEKKVKVNEDDNVLIEIEVKDSNNKTIANKNITIIHYADSLYKTTITTDDNGKSIYTFKASGSDKQGDDDYYGYNELIMILLPNDPLITDSPRTMGLCSELIINVDKKVNPSTEIKNVKNTIDTTNNDNINDSTKTNDNNDDKIITTSTTQTTTGNTLKTNSILNKCIKSFKSINKNKKITPNNKIIILEDNMNVTLSWLENFFNKYFANRQLLIYIDDTLVYNGTISSNSTETLFKIVKEYKGVHVLKVVEGDNVYQREFR